MNNKNRLKIALGLLALVTAACVCTQGILDNAAEGIAGSVVDSVLEEAQETIAAETGLSLEEVQATVDAVTEDMEIEEIQATAESLVEEVGGEGIQETAEAALEEIEVGEGVESEFPIPDSADTVVALGDTLNFTTELSIDEAVQFYRDEFTAQGYTERTLLTIIEGDTVNIVFDGHPSGQAIIVQMVDLGVARNVNVRLEDL